MSPCGGSDPERPAARVAFYLIHDPRPGRRDSERNCRSNIHPAGFTAEVAADKLAWLMREACRRALTGVGLKDESGPRLGAGDGAAEHRVVAGTSAPASR